MKKAEVKKGKKKNALKEYWPLYLMMLPALLYLLINNYIPIERIIIFNLNCFNNWNIYFLF